MPPDAAWLKDVLTGAERIGRFIHGLSREQFLEDEEKQSAVFGQLVIIGEAANRLSTETRSAHSSIPWRQIIGMRNRIVHGYDEIDWDIVWEVAAVELPRLREKIASLIPRDEP